MRKSNWNRVYTFLFILVYSFSVGICSQESIPLKTPQVQGGTLSNCLPEFFCSKPPQLSPITRWRHPHKSEVTTHLGTARHRGMDVITSVTAPEQIIEGELRYGLLDKDLAEEDVEIFACDGENWHSLGEATTDAQGHFTKILSGHERLPIGKRQLYLSVKGDQSSFLMLAIVLPEGAKTVVSDVDGTLTSSENAYPKSLMSQAAVLAHQGAKEVLTAFVEKCYQPVYVTSRGRQFTKSTHTWLSEQGFPIGPLRLAPSLITMPGEATSAYKSSVLTKLQESGINIAAGIGNRTSDIIAYQTAHVPLIFIKRPEFDEETKTYIEKSAAIFFWHYQELLARIKALPPLH